MGKGKMGNSLSDLVALGLQLSAKNHLPKKRRYPDCAPTERDLVVPTSFGPVKCRTYHPGLVAESDGLPPILVNFHGGGFVIGQPLQDEHLCRYYSVRAGVVVLNVDYYLAPKHRYPVPALQCYEVIRWAAENGGTSRGWDGGRLAVSGQSAGGNLATAACRMARDKGEPQIALQILNFPVLDLATPPKLKRMRAAPVIPPWLCTVFNNAYIPDRTRRREWMVSPALEENLCNLEGVPPAVVITCELDTLRDEGNAYAAALEKAGALREYHVVMGADHAYIQLHPDQAFVAKALDVAVVHLRALREITGPQKP